MPKGKIIVVKENPINIIEVDRQDYISLTDMAQSFGDDNIIYSWMRNRNTVEFLGIWEQLHNDNFKGNEFVTFKMQAGLNNFNLTPRKWIEATSAIGLISKAGRYSGGTYAHKDIAFEFGSCCDRNCHNQNGCKNSMRSPSLKLNPSYQIIP